jgi:hypothetical protein
MFVNGKLPAGCDKIAGAPQRSDLKRHGFEETRRIGAIARSTKRSWKNPFVRRQS